MTAWLRLAPAVLLAALAFAGCSDPQGDDGEPGASVLQPPALDAAALLAELRTFAESFPERTDNTDHHEGSRAWLAEQFAAAGLTVWRHDFETAIPQANVVGVKWGEARDQWVVVGAHYDMTSRECSRLRSANDLPVGDLVPDCAVRDRSQGAYDDGSGTLMVVHLARAFANLNLPYTIAFVAFDGEERGLEGSGNFSQALAEGATPWGAVTVRAMVDLDMIGINWPGTESPIYFDSNSPELQDYVRSRSAELGIPEDMVRFQGISLGRSDYAHFFALGVPTGFFISDFETWDLPANAPGTVPPPPEGAPNWPAYPFWHVADTYDTMELMAGSPQDLQAGFQTAVDLASGLVWFVAADPAVALTGTEM